MHNFFKNILSLNKLKCNNKIIMKFVSLLIFLSFLQFSEKIQKNFLSNKCTVHVRTIDQETHETRFAIGR